MFYLPGVADKEVRKADGWIIFPSFSLLNTFTCFSLALATRHKLSSNCVQPHFLFKKCALFLHLPA